LIAIWWVNSRPTAVNLADAATTLLNLSQKAAEEDADAAAVYEVRVSKNIFVGMRGLGIGTFPLKA
jgi:methylthioribose-1-phosphate isomerase